MRNTLLLYLVMLLLFGTGITIVIEFGGRLQLGTTVSQRAPEAIPGTSILQPPQNPPPSSANIAFPENLLSPLSLLLLQIIVIIVTARGLGALFLRIGQPAVVGEMVAGILLGPSLLGTLAPQAQAFLFPASSLNALMLLSQIGVILFMFVVGIDLNLEHLRQQAHNVVLISHISILVPFFLGAIFSLFIYRLLADPHISYSAFALFMGTAMSITAFPVLARIIEERGLSNTYLGSTALACAAVDDVTAWCILAAVVAVVKAAGAASAVITIFLVLLFGIMMLFLVKPRAGRLFKAETGPSTHSQGLVAAVLVFVFAAAMLTEIIGIHALFGAFLAGVAMPAHAGLRSFLRERIETFSTAFLLPLFFAFTGLRTQVNLLHDWQGWLICAGIIAIAITGKLGGSTLAARWTGLSWWDSLSIGGLMNTRGLIELIVLNIGYDMGILPPRVFTMMVLMALTTTLMTGPLLSLLSFWKQRTRVPV